MPLLFVQGNSDFNTFRDDPNFKPSLSAWLCGFSQSRSTLRGSLSH